MANKMAGQLVPLDMVSPGWEAEYTGESDLSVVKSDMLMTYSADTEGNVLAKYLLWGFENTREEDWSEEIRYINAMML